MMSLGSFWQLHAPIISILLPLLSAIVLVFLGNPVAGQTGFRRRLWLIRAVSIASASLGLIVAVSYVMMAQTGQIFVYALSEWNAPFGIVMVLDRLSALMVLLSSSLSLITICYACKFWDLQGRYFHAMMQFLLMGLNGAFLTNDLFNLFVFFEVLLISSYVLLIHGQGKARFQTAIQYVSINLFASALFLIGLGLIYGNVGSLNMTDVARILPSLQGTPLTLASAGALLLFVVFGIKAAMLPLGFWLPKTYAVASTPVALIFAVMTKVGVYAILRVNGLVFHDSPAFHLWQAWLLPLALLGSLYGVLAAFAAQRLKRFVGFMVLSSVSTLLIAVVVMNSNAVAAMLFYLLHSTLVAGAFYVLCEWIHVQRGAAKDHLRVTDKMPSAIAIGTCFLLLAWMMAGLPPFTGFMGKLMLLQASLGHPQQFWIFFVVLLVSLLSIIAFSRAGFILFWKARDCSLHGEHSAQDVTPAGNPSVVYGLSVGLIVMFLFTPQIYRYCLATAQQLFQPQLYQAAVLKRDAQNQFISVQPFDPNYVPETKKMGEVQDQNANLVPYILSPATLAGEHISLQKQGEKASIQQPTLVQANQPKEPAP